MQSGSVLRGKLCDSLDREVNIVIFVVVTVATVIFHIFVRDFLEPDEKISFLVAGYLLVLSSLLLNFISTPPKYYKSSYWVTVWHLFKYKRTVFLNAVPITYDLYLDIHMCLELERLNSSTFSISLGSIIVSRIVLTIWVWRHFHDFRFCFLQLLDLFQVREMYRTIKQNEFIILSLHKLRELRIVCENLPQVLVYVSFIADANSEKDSVLVLLITSLVSSLFGICFSANSLDKFMWENYVTEDKLSETSRKALSRQKKQIWCMRVLESVSSMITIVMVHYCFSLLGSLPLIGAVVLFVWLWSTDKYLKYSDQYARLVIWVIRAPTLTYQTFEHYYLAYERKKQLDEALQESYKHFYDSCNEALKGEWYSQEYEKKMNKMYNEYQFENTAHELQASICCFFKGWSFWQFPFYKVHIFVRLLVNLTFMIIIVCSDIDETVRWIYLGTALAVNFLLMFTTFCQPTLEPVAECVADVGPLPLHRLIEEHCNDSDDELRILMMENLVYCGYDLNAFNQRGERLPTLAARLDDGKMIEYFISAGFNVNQRDCLGQTALCVAILFQKQSAIEALLHRDHSMLDFIKPAANVSLPCEGSYELSPLLCCAARCDIETARKLFERNADVCYSGKGGNLFHVLFDSREAYDRKLEFLRLILRWGRIDINESIQLGGVDGLAKQQNNADWEQVEYKPVTFLWRMIQKWGQLTDSDNMSRLEMMIQLALDHEAETRHSCLPLLCAFQNTNNSMIERLLEANADPDEQDENGQTLLFRCLHGGHCSSEHITIAACAELLLHRNANIDHKWNSRSRSIFEEANDANNPRLNEEVRLMIVSQRKKSKKESTLPPKRSPEQRTPDAGRENIGGSSFLQNSWFDASPGATPV